MSPELETLDQLLGGNLGLQVIRALFGDHKSFEGAVIAMLEAGEIRLLLSDGQEAPRWRWRDVLTMASGQVGEGECKLSITDAGVRRIG